MEGRTWTLKLDVDGDIRRIKDWPRDQSKPNMASFVASVRATFDLSALEAESLKFKYRDDEGDLCTLADSTMPDALAQPGVLYFVASRSSPAVAEQLHAGTRPDDVDALDPEALMTATGAMAASVAADSSASAEAAAAVETSTVSSFVDSAVDARSDSATPCTPEDLGPATSGFNSFPVSAPRRYSWMWADAEGPFGHAFAARNTFRWSCWQDTATTVLNLLKSAETFPDRPVEMKSGSSSEHMIFADVSQAVDYLVREPCEPESAANPTTSVLARGACDVQNRLGRARPHVQEGVAHFKEKVTHDFRVAHKDMQDAFASGLGAANADTADLPTGSTARSGVATATAVVVAARLVPVRATRLAAHTVAAVVHPESLEGGYSPRSEPSAPILADSLASEGSGGGEASGQEQQQEELAHFNGQIVQDFNTAREDVRAALGYFTAPESWLPTVAATVAGATVATTLAPVRAARLAVAKLNAAHAEGTAADVAAPGVDAQTVSTTVERQGGGATEERADAEEGRSGTDAGEQADALDRESNADTEPWVLADTQDVVNIPSDRE